MDTLLLSIAEISLKDICLVILERGDFCHKPETKGPSSGAAAVLTHLAGTVMVCLAARDHRWEALGVGPPARRSSSVGGKGGRGL